jgi:hypothetical protein
VAGPVLVEGWAGAVACLSCCFVSARPPGRKAPREEMHAFLAASRSGDFEALIKVLDPEVTFRIDTGAIAPGTRPPIHGVRGVAEEVLSRGPQFAQRARPAIVNGAAGLLIGPPGKVLGVVGFTIVGGRIAHIDIVADPVKLQRLVDVG